MQINLYSFSKMNKSTKMVNSSAPSVVLDAEIKDKCTIEMPVLILDFDPHGYNYAYIPSWERFYFISGWQYSVGVWEISLTEDYLSSFNSEIMNSYAIVAYAASSGSIAIPSLVDKRIPVRANTLYSNINEAYLDTISWKLISYSPILSITGTGTNGIYYVNYNDLPQILDGVDQWFNSSIPDFFTAVKQFFYGGSAANCIKSSIGLCWSPYIHGEENLYLGKYPAKRSDGTSIKCNRVYPIEQHQAHIEIPWRYPYGDWRRSGTYSQIRLFLPLIGNVTISADVAKNDNNLDIYYSFSNTSGDINAKVVGSTSGITFATCSANGSVPIFLGSSNINTSKTTSVIGGGLAATAGVASMIASGGATAPAVLGIAGGLTTAAAGTIGMLQGSTAGGGGLGGGTSIAMGGAITCQVLSNYLSDDPGNLARRMGYPIFGNARIGSFSGYMQTEGMQFESGRASSTEKDRINSLLDSGIYIE